MALCASQKVRPVGADHSEMSPINPVFCTSLGAGNGVLYGPLHANELAVSGGKAGEIAGSRFRARTLPPTESSRRDPMATGIVFAAIGVLGYWLIRVRRQRKTRPAAATH
jgi:hypothetical protein